MTLCLKGWRNQILFIEQDYQNLTNRECNKMSELSKLSSMKTIHFLRNDKTFYCHFFPISYDSYSIGGFQFI